MASVFELNLVSKMHGQETQNVWNYIGAGVDMDSAQVLNFFMSVVLPLLLAIQSGDVELLVVVVKNLLDNSDNIIQPFTNTTGVRPLSALPVHDAWGYQLVPSSKLTRSGAKRFPGVAEADQNDGLPDSAIVTPLQDLADIMASTLIHTTLDATLIPIVLGTVGNVLNLNPVASGVFKRITTQNSRKGYTNSQVSIPEQGVRNLPADFALFIPDAGITAQKTDTQSVTLLLGTAPPYQATIPTTIPNPLP